MSAFASYASPFNSSDNVLPPVHTTGTEGSTYKYESRGGKRKTRKPNSTKMRKSKQIKKSNKSKSNKRSRRR
jgi:hypothetical protein